MNKDLNCRSLITECTHLSHLYHLFAAVARSVAMASFLKWFQDGYKNGKFTDIVIVASDGGETKVHDTMLEGRCPELKAQAVEVSEGRNRLSETGDVVTKVCHRTPIFISRHVTDTK